MSSLPSELQQLSLSAPAYDIPDRSENNQPSWMMMMPPSIASSSNRPPGASHARSSSSSVVGVIRNCHQVHRRSVSANLLSSLDYINNMASCTEEEEQQQTTRARTESPTHHTESTAITESKEKLIHALINGEKKKMMVIDYENVLVARDEQTGRYYCPFCNKAFNRPSSLRIHTYSHTGEKPFVCQEDGCGRQFSVQSNMRRHMRVHRLGRSKVKFTPFT
ncbi:hypothetical protein INT48_004318 [Thamnidium elegans]|uniref:C2H2-type domain-containing protein n=1 Tax=Thamnidium elegans TaxID=101142 RepID=A0A8H7W109_9FUNG|nr:hypothetical protein INT48_004318 [Thamnidium elegans]